MGNNSVMESIYVKVGANYEAVDRIVVAKEVLDLGLWGDPSEWMLQEDYDAMLAAIAEAGADGEEYVS